MADEQIKAFVRKHSSVQVRLTVFVGYLDNVVVAQINNAIDARTIIELQRRITKLEEVYDEFITVHSEIENLSDEDKLEEQYGMRNDFEDCYFQITARASQIIEESRRPPAFSREGSITSNVSQRLQPNQRNNQEIAQKKTLLNLKRLKCLHKAQFL